MATQTAGSKRKRTDEPKFYAVHIGHTPGIYNTYPECFAQIKGVRKALFKAFLTRHEAEAFVKHGNLSLSSSASSGTTKFYGVRAGKVPGVYTDWPSVQAQITGFKGPKYRSFTTRQEAATWINEDLIENEASAKPVPKGKKSKNPVPQLEADEIDENVEPGFGPLPKGSEDGFDRRIKLNPDTDALGYKSEGELKAVKMQATGLAKGAPIHVYTDGSALKNGAKGAQAGIGVWFGPADSRNVSEPLRGPRQTNQRAELSACKRAIEIAPRNRDMVIYTDSKYSISCLTEWFVSWRRNGWMTKDKKPVENKDLIETILQKIEERKLARANTKFEWVKGHADDAGNVAADHLAVNGAREGAFMGGDS